MKDYAVDFAERLKNARGGMSQSDLLSLLKENGVALRQARLSHYETGRNYPDPPILAALAVALGVSADWLLGLTEEQLPVADLEERLATATGQHRINRIMERLPSEKQRQLTDFADFLLANEKERRVEDDLAAWRAATEVLERRFGLQGVSDFLDDLTSIRPDVAATLGVTSSKNKIIKKG